MPRSAAIEATLMMWPLFRGSITLAASRQTRYRPRTLTAKTRSNSSIGVVVIGPP